MFPARFYHFDGSSKMKNRLIAFVVVASVSWNGLASACPFCSAIANTLSEDLSKSQVAVVAKWLDTERNRAGVARSLKTTERDAEDPLALKDFEITRVYKGGSKFKLNGKRIQATFRGQPEPNRIYLVFGFVDETINWTQAVPLRAESLMYLDELPKLPPPGPDRLKHFLRYLDHREKALADDAYNEFARAPYSDVQGLRASLDRNWLLERIANPSSDARRRQLYLTLLGVCGQPSDAEAVWQTIERVEASNEIGLDAAIACFLTLTKSDGLARIRDRYLARPNESANHAIMAIRFHGEELKAISRKELGDALMLVLDRPKLADLAIADLSRWEIWTAVKPMAKLFRMAEENSTTRVAAARFLMTCPTPEGKQLLAELSKFDPVSVRNARGFQPMPPPDVE